MGTYINSWALLAGRECILLVHWFDWYDWYKWNIVHSTGEMHIIMGSYNISVGASGWKGMNSTRPLVRLVQLVRVEYHCTL